MPLATARKIFHCASKLYDGAEEKNYIQNYLEMAEKNM